MKISLPSYLAELKPEELDYLVGRLPENLKRLFNLRYGREGEKPHTYKQIAKLDKTTIGSATYWVGRAERGVRFNMNAVLRRWHKSVKREELIRRLRQIIQDYAFVEVEVEDGNFIRRCPECTWSKTHDEGCSIGRCLEEER